MEMRALFWICFFEFYSLLLVIKAYISYSLCTFIQRDENIRRQAWEMLGSLRHFHCLHLHIVVQKLLTKAQVLWQGKSCDQIGIQPLS